MATTNSKAKAVAKAAKAETEAEPTVDEKRAERAKLMDQSDEAGQKEQKDEIAEQKAAGQGPKIDDAGAIEQQRAARQGKEAQKIAAIEEDPAVVAPVIEQGLKIALESRRDGSKIEKNVDSDRFVGNLLWVTGKGLKSYPGEVILDVRRENGSDHARFSSWAEDDTFSINLPGLTGPGDWLIHAEQSVVTVGEGRDDQLPVILESNELELELR